MSIARHRLHLAFDLRSILLGFAVAILVLALGSRIGASVEMGEQPGSRIVWAEKESRDKMLRQILTEATFHSQYRYWRGVSLLVEGSAGGSIPLLQSTLPKVASDFPEAHLYLAIAFSQEGRIEEACDAFDTYLSRDPLEYLDEVREYRYENCSVD